MRYLNSVLAPSNGSVVAALLLGTHKRMLLGEILASGAGPSLQLLREKRPAVRRNLSALARLNFNNKLMNFSNYLAVKTLFLEKARDLGAEFGEKHLVIGTSHLQIG
jgi:hypothetical protein